MKSSVSEKLRRFFDVFSAEDRVIVVINADPDAIASAMAIKRLLWRKTASVTLSHINAIQRPDNLAMIHLLGAKLVHTDDIDEKNYSRFVMVDSQPSHNRCFSQFSQFHAIIDHHPLTDFNALFSDIRPHYGAAASIMTEYLRSAGIKPSSKLATALFLAIKTDTHNFERAASIEDIRAFQFLFKHANMNLARKIEQSELTPEFLKYFRHAFENYRIRASRLYVHLGPVINPDICVIIADFFMRVHSISWSVVSGVFKDELVIIFRNDGLKKNAGNLAARAFSAYGSAGGHKSMARAEILLTRLDQEIGLLSDRQITRWLIRRIERKSKNG
ncbi:MAG: DHH family phosphoesterase [Desulfatirhabdiaceae bacterium]